MSRFLPAATAAVLLAVPGVGLAGKVATAGDQTLQITARLSPAKTSRKAKPRQVAVKIKVDYESLNDGAQIKEFNKTVVVTLPAGTKFRPSSRARCVASQLQTDGPSACPAASKVGQGTATADARPTVAAPLPASVTLFNGVDDYDDQGNPTTTGVPALLFYAHTDIGANSMLPFDIKANRLVLSFTPPAPGDTQLFHIQKVNISIPRSANAYVTAPRRCRQTWLTTMAITNYDGPTVTATDRQKCSR